MDNESVGLLVRLSHLYRLRIVLAGLLFGVLAALMTNWGNPANMGICVACFLRDIAGALGLHQAAVVQYLRPEIMEFLLGDCAASLIFREWRVRGESAPLIRFALGMFVMIGICYTGGEAA